MEYVIKELKLKAREGKYPVKVSVTNLGNISLQDGSGEPIYIDGNASVRKYTILVSQAGEANPTAIVLRDDIDSPVLLRTGAGTYTITKIGAFPAGKSVPIKAEECIDSDGNKFRLTWISADQYSLETFAAVNTDVLADGVLVDRFVNIEIYI